MSCLGFIFNPSVIGPGVVLGIASAGLYGLLSVSLVMTYRVSRTIGFVHGGLALFGTFTYWWLTSPRAQLNGAARMGQIPGAMLVTLLGAAIGVVYGFTVTGRLANWPRVRITTYSLGWLLGLGALIITWFNEQVQGASTLPLRSFFGRRTYRFFGAIVTIHQVVTVALLAGLMAVLTFVLLRTRIGIYIRAIADDPDAGRWVGIPLNWVGTGVYAFAGGLSTFAGILLASTVGISVLMVLVVFLRALTVSVLGGFTSLPLALTGCLLLGIGETTLMADLFGPMGPGTREIVIMTTLFGLVFLINRLRRVRLIEIAGL
ncbi:MAG TPA: branched-chain amino acid ABC transporter permease [Acidimicrobiia bacterium]